MNGVLRIRIIPVLATAAVCVALPSARGQQIPPTWPAPENAAYPTTVAYPTAADLSDPITGPSAPDGGHRMVPTGIYSADQASMAEKLARLEQWQQEVLDREAAAKREAAGVPSLKVGGRIMIDWALFDQSPSNRATYGDWGSRTEIRRGRIGVSGEAFHVIEYELELDFADNPRTPTDGSIYTGLSQSTSFKDACITINELPWLGHVRVGHFKEPFGLEQSYSTRHSTFMERSMCDDGAFVPGRNMGVMVFDYSRNERMTWAIGAFRSEIGSEPVIRRNEFEGGTALTMRGTFLPWYDEATDGRGLIHTGVSYSYRDLDDGLVQLAAQPEAHLAETILSTGAFSATNWQIAGGELAFVYGPFSIQSEIFGAWIDSPVYGDVEFSGGYAYVSYFLTGEHRVYRRSRGGFYRVKPFENFFRVRDADGLIQMGKGAWEIAYRYTTLDLNDVVAGGRAYNHTFGLNWYLNPYARLMFNYVNSNISAEHRDGTDGSINIFETRAQIDF